jgi:predicted transcriptional regulator
LPEQKIILELSLKDIDDGNTFTHDEAMNNAKEWIDNK